MKIRQSLQVSGEPVLTTGLRSWLQAWTNFWFAPTDTRSLTVVRLFTGLLVLGWLLPLAADPEAYFGLQGWFDRQAYVQTAALPNGGPVPLTWSAFHLCGSNSAAVTTVYWAIVGIVLLFSLGVVTRLTGPLTWVGVASCVSSPAMSYDGDVLLVLLTFYLGLGYLLKGQWSEPLAWWERLLGSRHSVLGVLQVLVRRGSTPAPDVGQSIAANLILRLIQVHFAIVILVSGLHKLQFAEWCSGMAFWYPLHDPFTTTLDKLRKEAPQSEQTLVYLSLAQYAVLAWQIGFPAFAWRRSWRLVLLGGAVFGWIGCAVLLELPLFGPAFLIACLSYVSAEEMRRWTEWLSVVRRWFPRAEAQSTQTHRRRIVTSLAK